MKQRDAHLYVAGQGDRSQVDANKTLQPEIEMTKQGGGQVEWWRYR